MVRSSLRRGVAAVAVILVGSRGMRLQRQPAQGQAVADPERAATEVTFAVYGPKEVIDAYKRIAADFTVQHNGVKVVVKDYPTHDDGHGGAADGAGPRVTRPTCS